MKHPSNSRHVLYNGAILFLGMLAWQALSGGWRQMRRARTAGQKVETAVQMECGLLSLLVGLTCFWQRGWAAPVRKAWAASLVMASGLSALVWGPPMPGVAVAFAAGAAFTALVVHRILGVPSYEGFPHE